MIATKQDQQDRLHELRTEIDKLDFMIYGHNSESFNRLHFTEKQKKVQELLAMRARLLELREKQTRLNNKF